ncbi:MAG: hypothetical protein ABH864_01725 [archaeon]
MIQLTKNKRAQEEMVGFVIIMLVVGVIFLVFLGIYLRGASQTSNTESKDIANFIEAVSKYTTRCGDSDEYPYSLITLVTECYKDSTSTCPNNGEKKCGILKETLNASIEENWNFNQDSPTKSYRLQVLRETQTGEETVLSFGGNPTTRIRSAEKPLPQGVILRLEIYY